MGLLTDLIERHVENKHQDEENRRQALRSFYYDRIHDPETDPGVREQLSTDYLKLLSPEAKKSAQKGFSLVGKLKQAFGRGPQQQQAQVGSPGAQQPTPAPAPRYPGQSPAPQQPQVQSPAARFAAGPQGVGQAGQAAPQFFKNYGQAKIQQETAAEQAAFKQKQTEETQEFQARTLRGKDAGLEGNQLQEYQLTGKVTPEKHPVTIKQVGRPGADENGKPYEGLWDHTFNPDGSDTWVQHVTPAPKGSGYIRSVPHAVSLQDAKSTAQAGAEYKDQNGNDIDLDKLPPNMGLQAMIAGDKMFWVPISPNQKDVTVGNVKYAATPFNISQIGQQSPGAPAALGASRTPTQRTSEQIAVNPVTGEVTKNTLRSSSTPATPGAAGTPATPAAQPARAPQSRAAAAPAPAQQQSGDIKGVPTGLYNTQLNRVIPVREAATQIFGDPSQPDLTPLKDYIKLADDPKSRERLGKALRLTFNAMNQATGGANITAGAGPISVSAGGFGQMLQNYFGVPQNLASQQTKIMQDAMKDLTPQEREAYDATMSSFSTIVGLRSLTRASAAQSSVQAIEREMPVIGVNTFDSSQFADQLQRLAEVVSNGVKGIPGGMLDPKLVQRINGLPAEAQKLKKNSPAKAPQSKKAAPKTADDFFKLHPELAPK